MANESEELLYVSLDQVDPGDFMVLMNNERTREHLVEHALFDAHTILAWIAGKIDIDATKGCRVRGIIRNNAFAGWCGIQPDNGRYELAIILAPEHWGAGKRVFSELMTWARELGHDEVYMHLLHTRPEYGFLKKISRKVFQSELLGRRFTTYQIPVQQDST